MRSSGVHEWNKNCNLSISKALLSTRTSLKRGLTIELRAQCIFGIESSLKEMIKKNWEASRAPILTHLRACFLQHLIVYYLHCATTIHPLYSRWCLPRSLIIAFVCALLPFHEFFSKQLHEFHSFAGLHNALETFHCCCCCLGRLLVGNHNSGAVCLFVSHKLYFHENVCELPAPTKGKYAKASRKSFFFACERGKVEAKSVDGPDSNWNYKSVATEMSLWCLWHLGFVMTTKRVNLRRH